MVNSDGGVFASTEEETVRNTEIGGGGVVDSINTTWERRDYRLGEGGQKEMFAHRPYTRDGKDAANNTSRYSLFIKVNYIL